LCETFGGQPVGLHTLAVAVAEEPETVEEVYEPFLLKAGLLQRQITEVFAMREEDLGVDHDGADGGVEFVGKFFREFAATDGVDARFERRDAQ